MSKSGAQFELDPSPTDAISSLQFSPSSNLLLVSSWDSHVYIYERAQQSETGQPLILLRDLDVQVPVLDLCWARDDDKFFVTTLQHEVLMYDLSDPSNDEPTPMSEHEAGANKIVYSADHDLVLSTGWDGTLHVHDATSRHYIRVKLAAKPFAISLSKERVVVAMAERKVSVYDLNALKQLVDEKGSTAEGQDILTFEPRQDRLSNLKFMARDVTCNPDGSGFATSSIEGRVSVEYFDSAADDNKYAFKCHRQSHTVPPVEENQEERKIDVVYPVNALAFHPRFGTFATGGGDGAVAIWDANTKRRVRQYKDLGSSVAAMDFSADGKFLAIGVSPGLEDGMEEEDVDPRSVRVVVRALGESEAKGKEKSKAKE